MINLLVIGAPTNDPRPIEEVASKVGVGDGKQFFVVRCATPGQLPGVIARATCRFGRIDILDLFDHGDIGILNMGNVPLFTCNGDMSQRMIGWEIAREIRTHLTETAHVRLLGCDTAGVKRDQGLASHIDGRFLLLKLAMELGQHRIVFGTINTIDEAQFSSHGFNAELAMLFSSAAALDIPATSHECRGFNIGDFIAPYPGRTIHAPADRHSALACIYRRLRDKWVSIRFRTN